MRRVGVIGVICMASGLALVGGCTTEAYDLRVKNETQRNHIQELESQLKAYELQLKQAQTALQSSGQQVAIEAKTLREQVAALEEDNAKKKTLIAQLTDRLVHGGTALPVELSAKLEDLSKNYPIISYDAGRGMLKVSTDLLFERGSDAVATAAAEAIKTLSTILNSEEAKKFDIVVAGHTDDVPILRPETLAKHASNWHLSAHRGIEVVKLMMSNGVAPTRLSVRGFGEFRPAAPNASGGKGNPQNRRVEIYLVPQGM